MPANPTNIANRGHRYTVQIENTSASQLNRVQDAGFNVRGSEEAFYELGNVNPTGSDKDPNDPTFQASVNLHGLQLERITSGKAASASSVTLGEIMAKSATLLVRKLYANHTPIVPTAASDIYAEEIMTNAGVSRIEYRFQVRGALTEQWSFFGADYYIESTPTHTWQAFDTVNPGGVKGRNAVLYIGGTAASDTMYRVQQFTIATDFDSQVVDEMGNRNIVGYEMGNPRTRFSFDILEADISVPTLLSSASGTKRIFSKVVRKDIYVMVFDPSSTRPVFGLAESATPIKAFKLEGVSLPSFNNRRQVNGLATLGYEGEIVLASTAGSGGMTMFSGLPA